MDIDEVINLKGIELHFSNYSLYSNWKHYKIERKSDLFLQNT